jgi:hypothetical protein
MGSNKSITVREKKRRGGGGTSVVIPFSTTSSTKDAGASLRSSSGGNYTARSSSRTSFYNHHDHPRRHSNNNMYHATDDNDDDDDGMDLIEHDMDCIDSNIVEGLEEEEYDEDTDDYDDLFFSPASTDIESDLDLLDKSGHEFPLYDGGRSSRRSQTSSSRSSFFSGGDWATSSDDTNAIRRTKMTVHDEHDDKLSTTTIARCGDGGSKHIPSIIQDEKYELDDMNDDVDYDDEEKIDMSGL